MTLWKVSVRDSVVSDIVERLSTKNMGFGYMAYANVDEMGGLYSFWVRDTCLYVGESTNLKRRLKEHCEFEENPILKENFDAYSDEIMMVIAYEENAGVDELKKLESEAIKKMHPIANRQGISE